ncbi:hypothetical protein [Polyangium sp. 6x1]|uniref:hypothetical protein n=1 Tax=Polyangium sp. 6x1 TaxID=3042689 RepID=UPI002482AB2F|nr:hypothetical protein [Polyangium sp. 6x1]MDI1443656.1 hypothetical protein [Polyangium sp. 6x1]
MRGALLGVLGILLVGCGASPLPGGRDDACPTAELGETGARVFVVQPRVDPAHFESYEGYRAHLVGLVQARVSPCLAADRPNVIVFPENTGLSAGFVGSRGQTARASSDEFPAALLTLGGQYTKPIDFYKSKWPETPLPTQILLGLTDTTWRAFDETNQAIVKETGAWLVSSTTVSGLVERSEDPAEIEALADPDLQDGSYVYVARDPAVYNAAFVYGPDGAIVATRKKPYPILMEEVDLALTPGPLREAAPVEVGPLGVGIVTGKDAWMPDMVDRLAALGADVFFQPEAFAGWTIPESADEPDAWGPDILGQSAMAAVQKHGALRYGVVPHLTGNLFDLPFDGQSIVVGDAVPGEARRAYVGQNEASGVIEVAPWVAPDPAENDPAATLESRRAALRAVGEALLPGGAQTNQYVETVIAADLDPALPFPAEAAGAPGALGASQALPGGEAEQSHPALAWSGGGPVVLAFQEGSRGATRVLVATSEDEGKTFGTPHPAASGGEAQITPAVLATGDHVYVAYQERGAAGARVACVLSTDRGKTFGAPVFLPSEGMTPDAWLPALAITKGRVLLAYVDGSSGNERVILARAPEGTLDFEAQPIEGTNMHPGTNIRNNQWAPAVAALGDEVAVAWVDFRNHGWDVFLARSADGGLSFGAPVRVDDGTDAPERLHDDPSLIFVPGGGAVTVALGWSDVRRRERNATARLSLVSGNVLGQSRKLGEGPAEASAFRPRVVALGAGSFGAVWQDDRTGGKDIYLATSVGGGASFGAERRLDDGGDGPSYQTGPAAAGNGLGGMVVAWEDTRSGRRRIRWVAGKP